MMIFTPLTEEHPKPEQRVLIKIKTNEYDDVNYYVVKYTKRYNNNKFYFEEASGEQYAYWSDDEILGWMPLEELDSIIVKGAFNESKVSK